MKKNENYIIFFIQLLLISKMLENGLKKCMLYMAAAEINQWSTFKEEVGIVSGYSAHFFFESRPMVEFQNRSRDCIGLERSPLLWKSTNGRFSKEKWVIIAKKSWQFSDNHYIFLLKTELTIFKKADNFLTITIFFFWKRSWQLFFF